MQNVRLAFHTLRADAALRYKTLQPTALVAGVTCTLTLALASTATADDTIRVWRVGSPHRGDRPSATVPPGLEKEWAALGFHVALETFRASGFAARFSEAVTRNAAPDVLVFDNFGILEGITTGLGRFAGIAQDPAVRQHLMKVTGAFDELRWPAGRGWTYLFALSPNHSAAKTLAVRAPRCPNRFGGQTLFKEIEQILPAITTAYLEGDTIGVQAYSDLERLVTSLPRRETVKVRAVRTCDVQGNDKLAVASVTATYESANALGHAPVLLVLRNVYSRWQLLVAARDPISNDEFVREMRRVAGLLSAETTVRLFPSPATLLGPATGSGPRARHDQRFRSFTWRSSDSDHVVAEIAEFAYDDDARLFVVRPQQPASSGEISEGRLWTTGGAWYWRIWSVSRSGDIGFSETRTFQQ
jgi:hypothetical protein